MPRRTCSSRHFWQGGQSVDDWLTMVLTSGPRSAPPRTFLGGFAVGPAVSPVLFQTYQPLFQYRTPGTLVPSPVRRVTMQPGCKVVFGNV